MSDLIKIFGAIFFFMGIAMFFLSMILLHFPSITQGDCFDRHDNRIIGQTCEVKTYDWIWLIPLSIFITTAGEIMYLWGKGE